MHTRIFRLPSRERLCLIEAILSLLATRLAFGVLSFRHALGLLHIAQSDIGSGRVSAAEALEVRRAIAGSARHVPFRAVCLHQACAAMLMLRRRGLSVTIHFGLARDPNTGALIAHAWSLCGTIPVTGGEAVRGFVTIAIFSA